MQEFNLCVTVCIYTVFVCLFLDVCVHFCVRMCAICNKLETIVVLIKSYCLFL